MYVTDLPDVDLSRSNRLQDSEISVGEGTRNGQSEQNKCLLGMRPAFGHSFLYSKEIAIQKQASCQFKSLNPQKIASSKPSDIELIAKKLFTSDDNILKATDGQIDNNSALT